MKNIVTVRDLIKALQEFPMDAHVVCVADDVDHDLCIERVYHDENVNEVILVEVE